MALTLSEAREVQELAEATAHSVRIEGSDQHGYVVMGVDNKTGYPFTVTDYNYWKEQASFDREAWLNALEDEEGED